MLHKNVTHGTTGSSPEHNGLPSATNVQRIAEIRARLDAATPGPWKRSLSGSHYNPWKVHRGAILVALSGEAVEDADLIAHAPADIAWLLDEVERLREAAAEIRADLTFIDRKRP